MSHSANAGYTRTGLRLMDGAERNGKARRVAEYTELINSLNILQYRIL